MTETTETQIISSGNGDPRFKLTKKRLILGVAVLVAIILAVTGFFVYQNYSKPKPSTQTIEAQFLKKLLTEKAGSTPSQNATYYLKVGSAYSETGDHQKALENYLKADTFIKQLGADAPVSANLGIAYAYKSLGDKQKAREYFQREVTRLESNTEIATESVDYINKLKKEISELK